MTPSSAALANSSKRWRKSRSSLVTAAPPHGRQAPTGWAAASTSGKPPGVYRSCEPFTLARDRLRQVEAVPVAVFAVHVDDPLQPRLLEQARRDPRPIA